MRRAPYQVLLLGAFTDDLRQQLSADLYGKIDELGLDRSAISLIPEEDAGKRNRREPAIAIFWGGREVVNDTPLLVDLIEDAAVIAPIVSSGAAVSVEIPPCLRHINALKRDEVGPSRVAALVLETFRLLRRERRLFISYRRVDSQPLAERLYDELDRRGFDVFIDLRSIPPAVDFQSELWHRMSDSDVVILIDTPGFRESRWTVEELATANATNIQILHLLWPGRAEDSTSSFSHFFKLSRRDFWWFLPGRGRLIKGEVIDRICDEAEQLRARALAARHRYLVDSFCDAARDLGMNPAVQPEHWISVGGGKLSAPLAVVPAIGIPTSNRINEIFDAIRRMSGIANVWIIFDDRGILDEWLAHLEWLDEHLPLRTVRMRRAYERLSEL